MRARSRNHRRFPSAGRSLDVGNFRSRKHDLHRTTLIFVKAVEVSNVRIQKSA